MKNLILILSLVLISCSGSTQQKVDRSLDISCPIVEAYGPTILAGITKQPIERFETLAAVCQAAHAVNESLVPIPVAGAPSR